MYRKVIWLLVSSLMAISLLIASCSPTEESGKIEEDKGQDEVVITETETGVSEVEDKEKEETPSLDIPIYGGMLSLGWPRDVSAWDNVYGWEAFADIFKLTNEELVTGDWAKGPAGTGETDWRVEMADIWSNRTGCIAESWDYSQIAEGIMTYHIRPGIHWALNPESEASRLVGGRELTADDVAYSLNLYISHPNSYLHNIEYLPEAEITATDKYTLVIKVPPAGVPAALTRFPEFARIIPHEVLETYGDNAMVEWKNSVGTGPFMVTDYVTSSSVTVVKNPNYWAKDPVGIGKGNQLPYLGGVKFLIMTDASTRMSALRTGAIDTHYGGVSWEDAEILEKQCPDMEYNMSPHGAAGGATAIRLDNPDLPFHDLQVRRAMMMAIDYDLINKEICNDLAIIPNWPIGYSKDYAPLYLPLDEAPESVQELYSYNPEKAKSLLIEAGYPEGFKTEVLCSSDSSDYYSILKEMWSDIGIDLDIKVLEGGTMRNVSISRAYEQMMTPMQAGAGTFYDCTNFSGEGFSNASFVGYDSKVEEAKSQMRELILLGKQLEAMNVHKELMKYVLDQAWYIPGVTVGYRITFWWPWLKNYHGEDMVGYHNMNEWTKYVWINEGFKKSMGY